MRRSDIKQVFDSKQFTEYRRSREAQNKMDLAICERLDNVVRAVSNLGQVVARKRSF
ncbi:hypothetical protein PQR05_29570 [Paraburkholderia sediminicola]|uniref:hypothetical protein n=1 Tax=Paraburkholderia sediminicola TaxID=458836 RepID=UPI0038BADB5C